MTFEHWINNQLKLGNLSIATRNTSKGGTRKGDLIGKWKLKFCTKAQDERLKLTFKEYLYKAYEAGLTCPKQISNKGDSTKIYHLGRYKDLGDYTADNCRFITAKENRKERDLHYDHSLMIKDFIEIRGKHWSSVDRPWQSKLSKGDTYNLWSKSDSIYLKWKELKECGGRKLNTKLNLNSRSTSNSLVNKFKEGWVPQKDHIWLADFRSTEIENNSNI